LCIDSDNDDGSIKGWRACEPTLREFALELHTGRIPAVCIGSGLLAMVMFWLLIRHAEQSTDNFASQLFAWVVTLVISFIFAIILAFMHQPSGH
jgi:hypothetical protein